MALVSFMLYPYFFFEDLSHVLETKSAVTMRILSLYVISYFVLSDSCLFFSVRILNNFE